MAADLFNDADKKMLLSPGRNADQQYQEMAPGRASNAKEQNCHITRCSLTSENYPKLLQCVIEGVVVNGLRSADGKR